MPKQLQFRTQTLPLGSLDAYIQRIYAIPLLSAQDEYQLFQQFRQKNDLQAAGHLVNAHLRFVVKIARGYLGYGLSLADLIQEGNVGLMKAVKRFDHTMGVRLVSFAVHWIKAEIHEFILRNWRIVKVATTKAQRKLFFNLRKMTRTLGWLNKKATHDMADKLNVKPKVVTEMEKRLHAFDDSFEGMLVVNEDHHFAPKNYLQDENPTPAELIERNDLSKKHKLSLYRAVETLDERSKIILKARWLTDKKDTLQVLANRFGVSAERIRQIENNAMIQLRNQIKDLS